MTEEWEEKKKIEDSLKVCHEIQDFLKRERKANGTAKTGMNPGTRSEIDRILKSLENNMQKENTDTPPEVPISSPEAPETVETFETTEAPEIAEAPETAGAPETAEHPETAEEPEQPPDEKKTEGITVRKAKKPKPVSPPNDETKSEYNETHPLLRTVFHILICVMAALLMALVITKFVANHTSVEGSSMETTLANEDQLIVERVSYYFHDPERFDIVVFPQGDHINYIKRIIGLPGERVQIIDGYVYINGELLDENYGRDLIDDPGIAAQEMKLGEDEYFVLGDNRNASVDSRSEEVGCIRRSEISGRAWIRIYPFDRVSSLE